MINKQVNEYWFAAIRQSTELDSSLKYLISGEYWPGRKHPLLQHVNGLRDTPCVHTRLKPVTSYYILQSNRAAFNHISIDPILCCVNKIQRLTECGALDPVRQHILETFSKVYEAFLPSWQVKENMMQLILGPSELVPGNSGTDEVSYMDIDKHAKRLWEALHLE